MQDENRRVWGHRVDFIQRRHPALGKLKLRPPADNAHPLRRGGSSRLLLEHTQRIGERRHPIPAKFHVVIQAAPDRVHVRIVETGDHRSPVSINDFGFRAPQPENLLVSSPGADLSSGDGYSFDK